MSSFSFGLVLSERFSAQTSHFCSAPPLGCGIHSPLWRQTANTGTSWRLICASRARSRAGARLGRTSRACSPPICTILRCLIKLVWASLHLSERSRTIEVRVATLSAQICTKSLTQSYLFYFSITCYFTYKDKKRPHKRGVVVCRCVAVALLLACPSPTKLTTTARRAISCAERKRTAFFCRPFLSV